MANAFKKIGFLATSTLLMLSLIFAGLFVSSNGKALADGDYMTSYDSTHEYTQAEVQTIAADLKSEIEQLYATLESNPLFEKDKDNYALNSEYAAVLGSTNYNQMADNLFNGTTGLRGIKEIASGAVEFYDAYVDPDSDFVTDGPTKYAEADWIALTNSAKDHLKRFKFVSPYDSSVVQTINSSFEEELAEYDGRVTEVNEYKATKKAELDVDVDKYYHSGKYHYETVNETVPENEYDVVKANIDTALTKSQIDKIADDYLARFNGIPTYLQEDFAYVEDNDNDLLPKADDSATTLGTKLTNTKALMNKCKEALARYDALEEKYKNEATDAENVLNEYKRLGKTGVQIVETQHTEFFNTKNDSVRRVVGENKALAYKVIDSGTVGGKLKHPYSYNGKNVAEIIDVVDAFNDSYNVNASVQYTENGSSWEKSKIAEFRSSVTYKGDDYEVTVTCVDASGNEVPDFGPDVELRVRQGMLPKTWRNINVLLKGLDEKGLAKGVNASAVDTLKDKSLNFYFNLTVFENSVVRTEFSDLYKVQIKFKNAKDVEKIDAESVTAFNYYHTAVAGTVVDNQITWESGVMTFTINDFTSFAIVDGDGWTDYYLIALIAAIAVVVLVILVAIIAAIARNRKYKVVFNANGGLSTKVVKARYGEEFSYPKSPKRKGYVFMGWYANKNFTVRFASTTILKKKKTTVYAKWMTEEEYNKYLEELKKKEMEEASKAVAPVEEAPAQEPAPVEEAPAPVVMPVVEEVPAFNTNEAYDKLKLAVLAYKKVNELPYGLDKEETILSLKKVGDAVELEIANDVEDLNSKGYEGLEAGTELATKYVVDSDDKMAQAEELIEEAMYEVGYSKVGTEETLNETDESRAAGYKMVCTYDKAADVADEYYKLIRVFANSFVGADEGAVEEKALLKMYTDHSKVYLYLNYSAEGLFASDKLLADEGFGSFMLVKDDESCKEALKTIRAMMKENGLVRYPAKVEMTDEPIENGFTYTLKA